MLTISRTQIERLKEIYNEHSETYILDSVHITRKCKKFGLFRKWEIHCMLNFSKLKCARCGHTYYFSHGTFVSETTLKKHERSGQCMYTPSEVLSILTNLDKPMIAQGGE